MSILTTAVAGPTWTGDTPTVRPRVVVLAPHPDDEVLGTGVLLRWLHQQGIPTTVVAVTDGEASHARSDRITPDALRLRRAGERAVALAALGVDPRVVRLGLPDGVVAGHVNALATALGAHLGPDCTVVAPWAQDGHPDHEAVAVAAATAVARAGAELWQVAIWAKVRRPDAAAAGARLVADPASDAAKRDAAACFRSQVHALGPTAEDGPVVHPHELAVLLAGPELVRVG